MKHRFWMSWWACDPTDVDIVKNNPTAWQPCDVEGEPPPWHVSGCAPGTLHAVVDIDATPELEVLFKQEGDWLPKEKAWDVVERFWPKLRRRFCDRQPSDWLPDERFPSIRKTLCDNDSNCTSVRTATSDD